MAAERIGAARCPLCEAPGASVSLTIRKLTCLTCNVCKCQVFSRGPDSDEIVRGRITANAPAVAAPAPASAPKPASPPLPTPTAKKTPLAPSVRQEIADDLHRAVGLPPKKSGFGLLKSW